MTGWWHRRQYRRSIFADLGCIAYLCWLIICVTVTYRALRRVEARLEATQQHLQMRVR
jgi:hypothetical protein